MSTHTYPLERTVIHRVAQKVCHNIDELGRTFCGSERAMPQHSRESCIAAGHVECETCESLLELWYVAKELGA